MKKRLILVGLLMAAVLMLTGCSSEPKEEKSLYVNVIETYVADDVREKLETELRNALPELFKEDAPMQVLAISSGDSEKDPMGTMAGMAQIAGMMASGEMELMLCDADNARRHGDNGGTFIPLDELFTKEEQEELGIVPLCIPMSDDEGELTGEMSAPCGIDLSGCTKLTDMLLTEDIGAYMVVNSKNIENGKTVIRHLLTMK